MPETLQPLWLAWFNSEQSKWNVNQLNVSCVHCRQRSVLLELVWTASITVATVQAAGTQTLNHQTIVLLVSWDNPLNWLITSNSIMKCGSSVKSSRLHLGISIDNCHLQNEAPGLIEMPTDINCACMKDMVYLLFLFTKECCTTWASVYWYFLGNLLEGSKAHGI